MKSNFIALIAAGILAVSCSNALAQSAPISGQRLALIEQEMFANGNQNFIVIDLVMDGLLEPGKGFQFEYNKGTVSLNGKKMKGKIEEKYAGRMKEFLSAYNMLVESKHSLGMNIVTTNDILDPNSPLRKPSFNLVEKAQELKFSYTT